MEKNCGSAWTGHISKEGAEMIISKIDSGTYEVLFTNGQMYLVEKDEEFWSARDSDGRTVYIAKTKTQALDRLRKIVGENNVTMRECGD
jgi:hypothetical protein